MNTHIICPRCKKPATAFTMTLWHGPNGFRRYPLCDLCNAAVKAEEKPKMKAVVKP